MAKEKINPVLEKENIKFNITALTDEQPVSEQILKFASKNKIDLIIVGSSQRLNKLSKIKALGSISRKISEKRSYDLNIFPINLSIPKYL
jgi:nucleotide-binding universal stress UspA family protein